MKTNQLTVVWVGMVSVMMLLASCATTYQTRGVKPSGFLKNPEQLQEGKKGQALFVYVNPEADFTKYKKILMEPVVAYASDDSKLAKLPEDERKPLLDYLDATMREQMGKDYELVSSPGPDVMRMRVAMCDGKGAKVVLNTVTTILPIGLAVSTLQRLAVGTHSAVAQTHVEMELLDSQSGERLAAAIDERAGRKITLRFDKFSKWEHVRDAFDWWAKHARARLAEMSGREIAD